MIKKALFVKNNYLSLWNGLDLKYSENWFFAINDKQLVFLWKWW